METEERQIAADGLPVVSWWDAPASDRPPVVAPTPTPAGPLRVGGITVPGARSWCDVCGAVPARRLKFRIVTGLVVWFKWQRQEASLCRTCGVGMGRRAQSGTLLRGWWSPLAVILNCIVILANAFNLHRAAQLPDPERPIRTAFPTSRSAWLHPAILIPVALFAGLGFAIQQDVTTGPDGFETGACARIDYLTEMVTPVSCDEAHDGRFIGEAELEAACPAETDSYAGVASGRVLCIDEDR